MSQLKVYYNERLHCLGIAEPNWELIAVAKFIPFVRNAPGVMLADLSNASEHVDWVELPMVMPKTDEWQEVGEF